MSVRTVWEKWNIGNEYYKEEVDTNDNGGYTVGNNTIQWFYSSLDFDSVTGNAVYGTTTYGGAGGEGEIIEGYVEPSFGFTEYPSYNYYYVRFRFPGKYEINNTIQYIKYVYKRTRSVKGTTSCGFISSISSDSYPDNAASGSYWYVKKGTDTLDPSAIIYDTPQSGQLLDISITPSTGKIYDGTVSYKYEISLDGGTTWSVVNESTTAEMISVLVPYGSESFTARVTASDNLGFTSTDAVTGQTLAVNNNAAPVITCDISDLGIVEAGFTVPYSVSDADGDDITVDIKLDGTKIQSAITPSGGGY